MILFAGYVRGVGWGMMLSIDGGNVEYYRGSFGAEVEERKRLFNDPCFYYRYLYLWCIFVGVFIGHFLEVG